MTYKDHEMKIIFFESEDVYGITSNGSGTSGTHDVGGDGPSSDM